MARRGVPSRPATPVPPRGFDPRARAKLIFTELTCSDPDVIAELRATVELTETWASDNGVELHPEWLSPHDPGWGNLPFAVDEDGEIVSWV